MTGHGTGTLAGKFEIRNSKFEVFGVAAARFRALLAHTLELEHELRRGHISVFRKVQVHVHVDVQVVERR